MVDYDFATAYELDLIAGRDFNKSAGTLPTYWGMTNLITPVLTEDDLLIPQMST